MEDTSKDVSKSEAEVRLEEMKGSFVDSLKRGNKSIKTDRAISIAEDAEMIYSRTIEDYKMKLKKLIRERENKLDMSPDNTMSLKLALDFNAVQFTNDDIQIGLAIRELEITIQIAEARYKKLFS
jgi:hypothetical protein